MAHWTDPFFTGHRNSMQKSPPLREEAAEQAAVIRRMLRLRKGSRVADVPCGDGRIALELARQGLRVTGVDRCVASVRRARRRFKRASLPGTIRLGDMRALDLPCAFNALINWWGSFGYFDDDTNLEVLRGFAAVVVPGGRVLIDQVNRERVLRQFRGRYVSVDYYNVRIAITSRWDAEGQRVVGSWTFGTGAERQRVRSSIRLYTPSQMKRLMAAAGLEFEGVYEGETGGPLRRFSRRMVTVGRKLR